MIPARDPRTPARSYKDSAALRNSHRVRPDGQPVFPLDFCDRPAPQDAPRKSRAGLRVIAALVAVVALVVALERRS